MGAIFCYQNLFESASSVTASSEATGYPKENAYDWRTDDFWQPNSASPATYTLEADMGTATAADYGAIYAHDLHTQGATIALQYSTKATSPIAWTTAFSVTPTTSAPIVKTFASQSIRYWRYLITGAASPPSLGVLAFGSYLEMEQGCRAGLELPTYARTPDTLPNRSQTGAFIGASVKRRGVDFSVSFNAVTKSWLRANWATFQDHFEAKPFFFAWDDANYGGEDVFCWAKGVQPSPVQNQTLIDISMNLTGLYL